MNTFRLMLTASCALALAACSTTEGTNDTASTRAATAINKDPYPSTYRPYPGAPTALVGATVFDGAGGRIEGGTVLFDGGKVVAVGGADLAIPAGYTRVDGSGKFVTPGIIDIHSHLGDYPSPGVSAHSDGNEATDPTTPEVWAEHSVWPQDPGFSRALANGGITSLQILPGSANLMGGRSVTLKNVPARTMQGMKFPDAPYSMKMRALMRYRRIPHLWVHGADSRDALSKVKAPVIPVMEYPDGTFHNDSTPLIYDLEARHAERSVIPPDPACAFIAHLIEDFADEWVTKAMFGYRWLEEVDQIQMSRWLAFDAMKGGGLAASQGYAVAVNYTANSLAADAVVRQIRASGGNPKDKTGCGNDPVIGAQHRRSKPADTFSPV